MLPLLNLLSQTAIQSKLTFTNRKADLIIAFLWLMHLYVKCREKTSNRLRSD